MFNWFKKKEKDLKKQNKLDYSKIDSNQKAADLFNKGELSKIYLMPLEFGGMESPMNSLYVPKFAQALKNKFDKTIEELLINGKKLSYSTEPEYKGNSFIPSKLTINVSGDSEFQEVIEIW
ncbi:hypothetical protein [Tenacibaculum sp. SDUM215027]|uniref:hypothetical protein n=1 Tax=Tenacibaculum sp. SDUM215027 TaxID=3422596 RepID=UPI003D3155FD